MSLRCVLVDDNVEFLRSAIRLLQAEGMEVVGAAQSGPEAIALAVLHRPDVVLVDVELGGESGFDVATQLEALPQPVSIIMISTYGRDDVADLLMTSPAIGFLAKSRLGLDPIQRLLSASRPET
jgi:DNA-binding NarL/FixJ family response regulator